MIKTDFLAKLFDEKKIQIVEPSENLKNAYLKRSEESLSSSKILAEAGNLNDSIALTYYSMYHSVLALFYRIGLKSENHIASITLLKGIFGIDTTGLERAKRERIDNQYYVDFHITKEVTFEMIKVAESFNSEIIDFIDKLKEKEIIEYRNKLVLMFNK
ncbi:MAG: HEPN domain-containing protein [Candidatus Methanofastidiosa archaeon]|nr:HEPN domain-containing protein [Candidatus Methanofastidiosa archaeon]